MKTLRQDVIYSIRQLVKSPGFTIVAAVTLALGVGVNTAIFSVVNGWLRPLPVSHPEALQVIAAQQTGDALGVYYFSYQDLLDYRKQNDSFSDLFAYWFSLGGLSVDGTADRFIFSCVTGNYFTALGVKPAAGRLFLPNEGEQPGSGPVIVLGYSYWQRRFGGDPKVVGKQVSVNGKPAVIIGIAPKGFYGVYSSVDMDGYLPLNFMAEDHPQLWTDRKLRLLSVLGRLNPAVSAAHAQEALNVIAHRLAQENPATNEGISIHVVPERLSRPIPQLASVIPILSGTFLILAAVVLVLASVNVANLLLVRSTDRQREMAIRTSLGATRSRLIRQLLTESLVLAIIGGILGAILGAWASVLIASVPLGTNLPLRLDFSFDWRVFLYALAMAVVTGFVTGIWPAIRASRTELHVLLQSGGRSDTASAGKQRLRNVLVVAQVAGSLMLLIVAARFVRTLQQAQHSDLGFDANHVLNAMLDPHQVGYDQSRTKSFYRELELRTRSLPGVESTTMAFSVPMGNYNDGSPVYVEGHPVAHSQQPPLVFLNRIEPGYFGTMRIPIVKGRDFADTDGENAPAVAIVNQAMAGRFWPGEDPIGKRFSMTGSSGPFVEVVGVAHDSRLFGYYFGSLPYFYLPFAQSFTPMRILQIRSSVPSETLIPQVRECVRNLEPGLPISDLQTMRQTIAGGNGFLVFELGAYLTAAMGLLGLTLAVVGVYGVVSYTVSLRTREIGIRVALGATPRSILTMVLRQGLRLVVAGVVVGLIFAIGLTGLLIRLLASSSQIDPIIFGCVTLLLAVIGLFACYIPARRATYVDPIVALHSE
jgi:macrolide transport system ATP-binding/permease protein